MLIRNIYTGSSKEKQHLLLEPNGEVYLLTTAETEKLPSTVKQIDKEFKYFLLPGLLDGNIFGFKGNDFGAGNVKTIATITSQLGQTGVAYCVASLAAQSDSKLKSALSALDEYVVKQNAGLYPGATKIVGVHLDGPFIAEDFSAPESRNHLQTTVTLALFKDLISSAPNISEWRITLAPEMNGAIDFIKQTQDLQMGERSIHVKVFIGHTNAPANVLAAAFKAGACGFSTLGVNNGEKIECSKETINLYDLRSNVVKYAATHNPGYAELIIDDIHLSDEFISFMILHTSNNVVPVSCDRLQNRDGSTTLAKALTYYHEILTDMGKNAEERAVMIHQAFVTNARNSALSAHAINNLPDSNHFLLVDNIKGSIIFHVTGSNVRQLRKCQYLDESNYRPTLYTTPVDRKDVNDNEMKPRHSLG